MVRNISRREKMSLQFIKGPSGAGKSHYLYQKITEESLKHPEKNYIVLVPDQFTMQTQRDLVMASPRKGIMNVDVLSFNRLAYRIFEEVGGGDHLVLDDVGKSFVLRKIAGDYEAELKVLGSNLKKTGFISEMQSIISEFTQYDVSKDRLDQMLMKMESETSFYYKLKDIATIYKGFQEYLQGKYITGEELLDLLCDAVPKSNILKDSVIVFDGFTGFTPVQNKLLHELFLVCEKIMVTVTTGTQKKNIPLFEMSDKMIESLVQIAKETKTEIESSIELFQAPVYRFKENAALGFLEANLFRYSQNRFEQEQEALSLWSAKNPKEEMDFVAQSIRKLVRKEGLRYREIAVIASDMDAYAIHAENAFQNYDIPVFMDYKRSILLNSFVEYVRSLLAMIEQNFTYESVFRYLRTELTEFTREEVDVLENYCVALGIKGYKKWQTKWIRRTKNMEQEELEYVNSIRERFVENVEEITEALKSRSKTVEIVTKALHEYLFQNELQKKVKEYETYFADQGELALEKEYAQVYRIVMELFDKFVELLGEEKISLKEYCQLLDAGLETAKVGIIPPSLDQVVVGDIERTRIKDVKVVFLVGANDAYIPSKINAGGLISERDREKFETEGITLAPSAKEKVFIQKFYLYLMLTKPSQKLVITQSKASSDGKALRPAYIVGELQKMYPTMQMQQIPTNIADSELTQENGVDYLAKQLQNRQEGLDATWQEVYSWYKSRPEWQEKIEKLIDAAFYEKKDKSLTRRTAEQLYGEVLRNSVSRLEKYSACAYAHFLNYGLRLQERETYQFQALDLGNLFHGAMEKYSNKLLHQGYSWTDVPEDIRDTFISESVEECIIDYGNTILYSSARNEYMIKRLERMMRRSVWALTKQLEQGDFRPTEFEVVYDSGAIQIDEDYAMRLYGKIDRIDVCESDDKVFVKVIDYKTGVKGFDMNEFYHGLQMQLVVYMNAALEREETLHPEKEIVPAGFLYYQMQDPIIDKEENEEQQRNKLLNMLAPKGIVNSNPEVLSHFEHRKEIDYSVMPVSFNKNGSISKKSSVLCEEHMNLLSQYAKRKVEQIGKEILEGNIDVQPYQLGEQNPCMFCPYGGVCGFDERLPRFQYKSLKKLAEDELLRKMKEEV